MSQLVLQEQLEKNTIIKYWLVKNITVFNMLHIPLIKNGYKQVSYQ